MADDKKYARELIGKTIVSKSGKRFGEVGDITFEIRTGELISIAPAYILITEAFF